MGQTFSYATPLNIDRREDCFFYHTMHIPGVGDVGGEWDLRSSIEDYLGRFDFRGKRVLDVGAASGFLTFEMEKRGAEVVSFDMLDGSYGDVVPHTTVQKDLDNIRQDRLKANQRLKNAYWFAHRRLGSKARAYYGDIYDLPGALGTFDVAVFGMILSHLRDPLQALYSASRLVSGTIIVTNQMMETKEPMGCLIPSRENGERRAWWGLSRACITQMLGVLGFDVKSSTTCDPLCLLPGRTQAERCVSLVAQRVAGSVCLTGTAKGIRAAA
jgi:SAM-dependent methyltransferase